MDLFEVEQLVVLDCIFSKGSVLFPRMDGGVDLSDSLVLNEMSMAMDWSDFLHLSVKVVVSVIWNELSTS